jgi:hypothetical protein
MRVRTGRFKELRSRGKSGKAQLVEVADGEGNVNELRRVPPPAAAVGGHSRGAAHRESPGAQFVKDGCAPTPLFQVDGTQSVSNPFVQLTEDIRGFPLAGSIPSIPVDSSVVPL